MANSGAGISWEFTFDTPQPDSNYLICGACEVTCAGNGGSWKVFNYPEHVRNIPGATYTKTRFKFGFSVPGVVAGSVDAVFKICNLFVTR